MSIKLMAPFLALGLACPLVRTQQTGTVVGTTPGSAISNGWPRAVRVIPPKPTCDSSGDIRAEAGAVPALPDMVFARMDLLCVRYPDGRFEELPKNSPGLKSPNGKDAAYWIREKHELHVRSPVNGNDNVVDALPDVTPQQMFWSVKGRALVYPVNTTPLVAVDVRSGKMTTLTNPGQNGPDTWLGWR